MGRPKLKDPAFWTNLVDPDVRNSINAAIVSAIRDILTEKMGAQLRIHLHGAQDSDRWTLALLRDGKLLRERRDLASPDEHHPKFIAALVFHWLRELQEPEIES
jgi:hypothetical protein